MNEKTTTITLSRPLELRSAKTGEIVSSLAELTLREPTAGDMAEALDEAGGMSRPGSMLRFLVCRCAGLSRADFDNMPMADAGALFEAVSRFLPDGQPTGPTH